MPYVSVLLFWWRGSGSFCVVCCVAYVAYAYVKVTGILRCAVPMTELVFIPKRDPLPEIPYLAHQGVGVWRGFTKRKLRAKTPAHARMGVDARLPTVIGPTPAGGLIGANLA